ncbi:hypothetical protein GCM10029964_053050 [Kibdelosporangium lantanae]
MTAAPPTAALDASALSCLTSNLATYLGGTEPDPLGRIARTVRLTVRTGLPGDLLAFSHHRDFLGRLADGRHLRYRGTSQVRELVEQLDRQLSAAGQVLVVAYAGSMPWSLAEKSESAPHLVRVTGHDAGRWQVDDRFSALMPAGVQPPFQGWVTTADLLAAMAAPGPVRPEQRLRLRHAFGGMVALRANRRYQWLVPTTVDDARRPNSPHWHTDTPAVLDLLSSYYSGVEERPQRARLIDDVWSAAQHHVFRYGHLLRQAELRSEEGAAAETARKAWADLPLALFYAASAAARGKPRPAVVPGAFDQVRAAELACAELLARHGYR